MLDTHSALHASDATEAVKVGERTITIDRQRPPHACEATEAVKVGE